MSLEEGRVSQQSSSGTHCQDQTEARFAVGSKEALPLLQCLNFSGPAFLYGKFCLSFALEQCAVVSQRPQTMCEVLLEKSKALIGCYLRARI